LTIPEKTLFDLFPIYLRGGTFSEKKVIFAKIDSFPIGNRFRTRDKALVRFTWLIKFTGFTNM